MNKRIMVLAVTVLCMLFTACQGKEEEAKEYTNKGNAFSISVPGEWVVTETNNEDHLVLDNEDQSLSILIQRFPQEGLEDEDGSGLEEFIEVYKSQAIPNLVAQGVQEEEAVEIPDMKHARAEGYEMTQSGQVFKAYLVYVESDVAYYSVVITGSEDKYDPAIEKLKEAVKTLKEL